MKTRATKFFKSYFNIHDEDMELYNDTIDCLVKFAESEQQQMKLKLWNVYFEPIYPIGGCLILLAYDEAGAKRIASMTIKHTAVFTVEEISMDKPLVVIYQSGDY